MALITIRITEERDGWFVTTSSRLGPFFSRQRAVDLGLGMATAMWNAGMPAELVMDGGSTTSSASALG